MIIRSRAPLRLGLAGGGTDVSPFSEMHGGAVLNGAISLYAYATIEPVEKKGMVIIESIDMGEKMEYQSIPELEKDGKLILQKGVYNRIVKEFIKEPMSCKLSTFVDAPSGSGLGSSSTLVVAVIGAFAEWQGIPLGEYDIAHLAYEIERSDLKMAGGKQDQYAAAFGGINFMEFFSNDKVIVNPLRIKQSYLNEMELNIALYYTGTSRFSSEIVQAQSKNISENKEQPLNAMHKLKEQAIRMKEAILKGELYKIGELFDFGWKYKKMTAPGISNPVIEKIYNAAKDAGATGGKISGAGGGGFMMFFCPDNKRYNVINTLHKFGGEFRRYHFVKNGLTTWKI